VQPNSSAGAISGSSGVTSFLGLTDTPASYSGETLNVLQVNAGETALEFTGAPVLDGLGIGTTNTELLHVYAAAADAGAEIESYTDDAKLYINSGTDGAGGELSKIELQDNSVAKFTIQKDVSNDFSIYDEANTQDILKVTGSTGAVALDSFGEMTIAAGGDIAIIPTGQDVNISADNVTVLHNDGNASLIIESTTDNAEILLNSGMDGTEEFSIIKFADHSGTKYAIWNSVDTEFVIYSYAQAFFILKSNNDDLLTYLRSKDELRLWPENDLVQLPINGSVIHDPGSDIVRPQTNYDVNLGTLQYKYLTLHAAELWVETLVAADTMATIGGRILVGPTTQLIADLGSGDATMDVKHNQIASGDRVVMEADGKLEFMAVTSSGSVITGGYRYSITRNLDGSGANDWYAGDAVFNTGATGDGWMDLYSYAGLVPGSTAGPTIVGNIRGSATYNDYDEGWAIGNLKGLYGYGSDIYGAGFGIYDGASPYMTIDPTNGIIMYNAAQTATLTLPPSGDASMTGTLTIDSPGEISAGGGNVIIDEDGINLFSTTSYRTHVVWKEDSTEYELAKIRHYYDDVSTDVNQLTLEVGSGLVNNEYLLLRAGTGSNLPAITIRWFSDLDHQVDIETRTKSIVLDDDLGISIVGDTELTGDLGVGRTPTADLDIYTDTGDTDVLLESEVANVYVTLNSNADGLGIAESRIKFQDNNADEWSLYKTSANYFVIWDHVGAKDVLNIRPNGNFFINPVSNMYFTTNLFQVTGTNITHTSSGNTSLQVESSSASAFVYVGLKNGTQEWDWYVNTTGGQLILRDTTNTNYPIQISPNVVRYY
jgi:hypothetical protein